MSSRLDRFKEKGKGYAFLFLSAGALIWLDQWTKRLAVAHLKGQEAIVLLKGVFELRYLENRGAAFGMLQGRQAFFFLVGILVLGMVLYGFYRMPFTKRYLPLGICMVLLTAGAFGNMADRIAQQFVVDFLYFSLIDFPIFNVADCYVTVAAFLLIGLTMFYYKDEDLAVFAWKQEEKG